MTQVNSPFLLPKVRPKTGTVEDLQNYLSELERILQQLYRRTGAESDDSDEVFPFPPNALVPDTSESLAEYIEVTGSYATGGTERLMVGASVPVALNANPVDGERVRVKLDGDYSVTITAGGGKTIDGELSIVLYIENTLVDFVYYAEKGEWVVE